MQKLLIPTDGICTRCNKFRGYDAKQWTLVPDFIGCKYCFRTFIPDTKQRRDWLRLQKAGIDSEQLEARRLSDLEVVRADLAILIDHIIELKTIMRGFCEMRREAKGVPEPISAESNPTVIKAHINDRLSVSPDSLSNDERMRVGRLTVGYELQAVLGTQAFHKLFEDGSSTLITNRQLYIAPQKVFATYDSPPRVVVERCRESGLAPHDWLNDEELWFQQYRPADYIKWIWEALDRPSFTTRDKQRYGWPTNAR